MLIQKSAGQWVKVSAALASRYRALRVSSVVGPPADSPAHPRLKKTLRGGRKMARKSEVDGSAFEPRQWSRARGSTRPRAGQEAGEVGLVDTHTGRRPRWNWAGATLVVFPGRWRAVESLSGREKEEGRQWRTAASIARCLVSKSNVRPSRTIERGGRLTSSHGDDPDRSRGPSHSPARG